MAKRGFDIREFINNAVTLGIENIVKRNPAFEGREEYLGRYIDNKKLMNYFYSIAQKRGLIDQSGNIVANSLKNNKILSNVSEDLVKYVSSSKYGVFNPFGQKIINKAGGIEKLVDATLFGKAKGRVKRAIRDKTRGLVFGDYHNDFGEYAQRIDRLHEYFSSGESPAELAPIYQKVEDLRGSRGKYLLAVVSNEVGIINNRQMRKYQQKLLDDTRKGYKEVSEGVGSYLTKVAASILGLVGLGTLFFSGRQLTGNAVGNIGIYPALGFFVGISLIFASFFLFAKISRDKKKAAYMCR